MKRGGLVEEEGRREERRREKEKSRDHHEFRCFLLCKEGRK